MKVYESQKIKSLVSEVLDEAESFGWYKAMVHLQRRMTDIPEMDAEPVRHGKWSSDCVCSECGEVPRSGMEENYCPNCGVRMDGENKND